MSENIDDIKKHLGELIDLLIAEEKESKNSRTADKLILIKQDMLTKFDEDKEKFLHAFEEYCQDQIIAFEQEKSSMVQAALQEINRCNTGIETASDAETLDALFRKANKARRKLAEGTLIYIQEFNINFLKFKSPLMPKLNVQEFIDGLQKALTSAYTNSIGKLDETKEFEVEKTRFEDEAANFKAAMEKSIVKSLTAADAVIEEMETKIKEKKLAIEKQNESEYLRIDSEYAIISEKVDSLLKRIADCANNDIADMQVIVGEIAELYPSIEKLQVTKNTASFRDKFNALDQKLKLLKDFHLQYNVASTAKFKDTVTKLPQEFAKLEKEYSDLEKDNAADRSEKAPGFSTKLTEFVEKVEKLCVPPYLNDVVSKEMAQKLLRQARQLQPVEPLKAHASTRKNTLAHMMKVDAKIAELKNVKNELDKVLQEYNAIKSQPILTEEQEKTFPALIERMKAFDKEILRPTGVNHRSQVIEIGLLFRDIDAAKAKVTKARNELEMVVKAFNDIEVHLTAVKKSTTREAWEHNFAQINSALETLKKSENVMIINKIEKIRTIVNDHKKSFSENMDNQEKDKMIQHKLTELIHNLLSNDDLKKLLSYGKLIAKDGEKGKRKSDAIVEFEQKLSGAKSLVEIEDIITGEGPDNQSRINNMTFVRNCIGWSFFAPTTKNFYESFKKTALDKIQAQNDLIRVLYSEASGSNKPAIPG